MKRFDKVAAQGDLLIRTVTSVPEGWAAQIPTTGQHVVAHSETGHHHVIDAKDVKYYTNPSDQMRAYLVVKGVIEKCLEHLRAFDTHESISLPPGIYELRRQREYIPEGWRKVED